MDHRPADNDDVNWAKIVDLTERAIDIRERMVLQIAKVIVHTKAYWLDEEVLIGAILEATEETDPIVTLRRKFRGESYFASLGPEDTSPQPHP